MELHIEGMYEGEALYLHKLAVKRAFAGQQRSKEMIEFAKAMAKNTDQKALRLDCNAERRKLRNLYEECGFHLVKEYKKKDGYPIALYEWRLDLK